MTATNIPTSNPENQPKAFPLRASPETRQQASGEVQTRVVEMNGSRIVMKDYGDGAGWINTNVSPLR